MSSDISNSCGAARDLLCRGASGFLLWCAPWLVFGLGLSAPPLAKNCSVDGVIRRDGRGVFAQRCPLRSGSLPLHRTVFHPCRYCFLSLCLGLLPLGPSGWKWIGAGTIIGACALTCIPELLLGRYRRGKETAA